MWPHGGGDGCGRDHGYGNDAARMSDLEATRKSYRNSILLFYFIYLLEMNEVNLCLINLRDTQVAFILWVITSIIYISKNNNK